MSIYKIVALILILIVVISSIGGIVLVSLGGVDIFKQGKSKSLVSNQKIKLEFDTLELAVIDAQRQLGYMNRESICARCGMLFVFEKQQPLSFWMKNTLVPLKISFIDESGKVLNTSIGQPNVTSPAVISAGSAKYALEVPIDSQLDLKSGQQVDIEDMITNGVKHSTINNDDKTQ